VDRQNPKRGKVIFNFMTVVTARRWLVSASLLVCSFAFLFFLIAPAFNYPLTWEQATRVIEIILPVFLGYLGTAARYLFRQHAVETHELVYDRYLMGLLVRSPIVIFVLAGSAVCFSFGYSNRPSAPAGSGMSVDSLCWAFTALLGMLAVTTGAAVAFLFPIKSR
jgi:hypothetical protein